MENVTTETEKPVQVPDIHQECFDRLYGQIVAMLDLAIKALGVDISPSSMQAHMRHEIYPVDNVQMWWWDDIPLLQVQPLKPPSIGFEVITYERKTG